MNTKLVKNLVEGDQVVLKEPDGIAVLMRKKQSAIFKNCHALSLKITSGAFKGNMIKDYHLPKEAEIEIC